jgi:hypothetical protein
MSVNTMRPLAQSAQLGEPLIPNRNDKHPHQLADQLGYLEISCFASTA